MGEFCPYVNSGKIPNGRVLYQCKNSQFPLCIYFEKGEFCPGSFFCRGNIVLGEICTWRVLYLESFVLGKIMYWRILSLESNVLGEFSISAGEYCPWRYLSLESFVPGKFSAGE